jgi:hypothetical protein
MSAKKRFGLILTLGGAPASPHVVSPLPGYYRPDVPHLVGGPDDDLTLEQAKEAAEEHDCLKLVEVSATKEEAAEEAAAADLQAGRNALIDARRDGRAGDAPSRAQDEAAALKGAE